MTYGIFLYVYIMKLISGLRLFYIPHFQGNRKIRCRISEPSPSEAQGDSPTAYEYTPSGEVRLELIGLKHEKSAQGADFYII